MKSQALSNNKEQTDIGELVSKEDTPTSINLQMKAPFEVEGDKSHLMACPREIIKLIIDIVLASQVNSYHSLIHVYIPIFMIAIDLIFAAISC
jgi:hypothetical protein